MDITRSPEGRDSDNRPFSGPSSGVSGHCSTDNVVTPVTTTGKRKCRSADGDEHCNEKKKSIACSSQEADAAVIDVTSEEVMEDSRPFLTVNNKRNRDVRRLSDKNITEIQRPPQKFAAYMKGVGHNIAREAVRRHKEFKSEIHSYCGQVDIIEARKDCVRFVCSTERQRDILLEIKTVVNKDVNVTKPYSVMKQQDQPVTKPKRWPKGVISGVPTDTTDDEVKEETSAVMVRRITRMVDGEIIPTRSVIIAFEDELPREVFVHLRRYRVELYVPKPIRCNKCQAFGHKTASCEAITTVCSRCSSKKHGYSSCPVDKKHAKCANCGENHNAAYKGCIKYKTIDRALNISVKQGISYRDAVTQIKKTYTEEKTRSTSTSSDITQQTERVQGAKKATSAVASGTKTIKTVPACNKTDRTDDKARKETSAKATPTLASEANKSTSGNTSTSSSTGDQLREDQMLCLITTTATALLWVVRNIQPTSGQLQVVNQLNAVLDIIKKLKMKTATQSAVVEESTQQETTKPTTHDRRGTPNDVNDANDDISAGRQGQAATQ